MVDPPCYVDFFTKINRLSYLLLQAISTLMASAFNKFKTPVYHHVWRLYICYPSSWKSINILNTKIRSNVIILFHKITDAQTGFSSCSSITRKCKIRGEFSLCAYVRKWIDYNSQTSPSHLLYEVPCMKSWNQNNHKFVLFKDQTTRMSYTKLDASLLGIEILKTLSQESFTHPSNWCWRKALSPWESFWWWFLDETRERNRGISIKHNNTKLL